MQRGQIFKRHGAWHLRYRASGKQVCQKLADYCDDYRTVSSVRQIADDILKPINRGGQSTGTETLQEFIEGTYLPHVQKHNKPSTYNGYRNLYNLRVKPHVAGVRLFGFRTRDGQKLLEAIAESNGNLSQATLIHVKSFLSGAFSFAKRMGSFDGANPIRDTKAPRGRASEETYAYSHKDVSEMLKILGGVSRVAVTVAAYTGLSLGELRGLRWEDISGEQLNVNRTIWRGIEGEPKTNARKNAIPLLPIVRKELDAHRKNNPGTTWVFESPLGKPFDLATIGSKGIKPALENGAVAWHGWHALRRGFATRLHEAGVQDRIIQSLMRHSSLSVTMKHYVKALPEANVKAMQRLE